MQRAPYVTPAKKLLLHPYVHGWVRNLLRVAKRDPTMRKSIQEWQPGNEFPKVPTRINESSFHSGSSLSWTLLMVQHVINTPGCQIRKDRLGYDFMTSSRE